MKRMYSGKRNCLIRLVELTEKQFKDNGITSEFPQEFNELDLNCLEELKCDYRKDFTNENAFTIDSADCKDMDDAVSVLKIDDGYRLSVHIADVSSYIPLESKLDQMAINRATSIYLPHVTIPMLPSILSNNLCSLNVGVYRNTLSVVADINSKGEVTRSEISKGRIRSRVKGVYTEINALFAGDRNKALLDKYKDVYPDLFNMADLYSILRAQRIQRGASVEDSNKPKIIITENYIDLTPIKEGIAENMIEEFMILANRIVAEYLCENNLPAIFRIQERKNNMAAYKPIRIHHAELALDSYSHFTSPIRRIADLKIHQILTFHLNGVANEQIHRAFDDALTDICERATKKSRTVKQVQTKCERFCYEQFFSAHSGDKYIGTLIGFDRRNRPVVQVNNYNIRVIGYSITNGIVGDKYSFSVGVSNRNNELFANSPHRIAA